MSNKDHLINKRHYVYRHFDAEGRVLYVGCSIDVERRFRQHLFESTWWAMKVARTKITVHPTRAEGRRVEKAEIRNLEPLHNSEKYWMDTDSWDEAKFIEHASAFAETPYLDHVDRRSAAGRLYLAYRRKFGGDLFGLIGPIRRGYRQIYDDRALDARTLTYVQDRGTPGRCRGRAAA